jgi:hypothetical protein
MAPVGPQHHGGEKYKVVQNLRTRMDKHAHTV